MVPVPGTIFTADLQADYPPQDHLALGQDPAE
jgi:hypothetical protein